MKFKQIFLDKLNESALLREPKDFIFHREFYIPISTGMIKRIYGETKQQTAFHILGLSDLKFLEKLQGKKKAISVSTQYHDSLDTDLKDKFRSGIYNAGGAIVELKGDILLHSNVDVNSDADSKGRRWIPISYFKSNPGIVKYFKNLQKFVRTTINKKFLKGPELSSEYWEGVKNSTWELLSPGEKKKIIKSYFELIEKNINKNKDLLKEFFFAKDPKKFDGNYHNEALMQNFQIKKVYILKGDYDSQQLEMINKISSKHKTEIVSIGDLMSHLPIKVK